MTKFEKYFIEVHRYLNEIGLNHWLIGSSLLGPIRDGCFLEGDREVNFGVMANDLIEAKPKLMEKYKLVFPKSISRIPGVWLVDKDYKGGKIQRYHPNPFTWLAPHYLSCGKVVQTVGASHILFWDEDILLPMGHMEHIGEVFTIPCQSKKWLEAYYGEGWKVSDTKWCWQNNSHNHINLEELDLFIKSEDLC